MLSTTVLLLQRPTGAASTENLWGLQGPNIYHLALYKSANPCFRSATFLSQNRTWIFLVFRRQKPAAMPLPLVKNSSNELHVLSGFCNNAPPLGKFFKACPLQSNNIQALNQLVSPLECAFSLGRKKMSRLPHCPALPF